MISLQVMDIGLRGYAQVLALQEQLYHKNIADKQAGLPTQNYLLLCEHPPVFTLGKSGKRENILVSDEAMQAEFYHVNRGGDVTFHGPGQLVVYPILDLDTLHLGLAQYVFGLEQTLIELLAQYNLPGERIEGAAGIWLRNGFDRKVAAIGIKASRNITMHGLALNVNTDLSYFDKIVPCGLQGKATTSLQSELHRTVDMPTVKQQLVKAFERVFGVQNC